MNQHILEPEAQEIGARRPRRRSSMSWDRRAPGRSSTTSRPRHRQARGRREVDQGARRGRRRRGPHRQAVRCDRSAAGGPVRARRRLGARQRRHSRPARARAGGRGGCGGRVRRVRPLPRGHYPVAIEQAYATARWITPLARRGSRRLAPGGGRRFGRREHGCRAGAAGQAARRCDLRAPVALLPRHRRRPGHRQLPRVRRRPLPLPGRWPGSGTPTCPSATSEPR